MMLKKLLILSLFFHIVGFTPTALASQEPASNSWGFGTFLAAGAALIGGFKLALWGAPKLRQTTEQWILSIQRELKEKERKRKGLHFSGHVSAYPEIADEMVDNILPAEEQEWQKDHIAERKQAKMSEFPIHIAPNLIIEINDTDEKQKRWLNRHRVPQYTKWARMGFSTKQLQQAANENIPLHAVTLSKINRLVLTSYFVDSHVHSLIRKFKIDPQHFELEGGGNGLVPLFTPPLLKYNNTLDSCELMNHLPKDVAGICDAYADGEISNPAILVNKRKLMLALGALSCRERAGVSMKFKNIHETDFGWVGDGDLYAYRKENGLVWFEKNNPNWREPHPLQHWNRVPEWQINDEEILCQLCQDAYAVRLHDGD